ncbi:MAG: SurA N-terminal domain-containing protein [Candidatus Omnitrophica bacterium]|nr:Chaperone SurA [bacterium]NUN96933.1 SurA N-terminal domain-containing protein [Candidatus Omnitrophota bacterium]
MCKQTPRALNWRYVISLGICLLMASGCSKPPAPEEPLASETVSSAPQSSGDCPPGVVASVDGRPITRDEADRRAAISLREEGVDETDPEYDSKLTKARKGAVDVLVQAYLLQSAATGDVEVSTEEVAAEMLTWKTKVPSKEAWDEFLANNNVTEEEFGKILEKEIRLRRVMEKAASRDVPTPTPDEARQFYEVTTHAFAWPHRVQFEEVRWIAPPDLPEASVARAEQGMRELSEKIAANPGVFDEILASTPTGKWEPVGAPTGRRHRHQNVKDLEKPIQEALKSLVPGEISPVIRTSNSFSIIRIVSLRQSYDSAYPEILQSIYSDRCRSNLENWIERLKQKARIRICDQDYYMGDIAEATAEATIAP